MKNKKWIFAVLIVVVLLLALRYLYGFYRIYIIRASLEWDLPWWLQKLLWGW